MFVLIIRFHTWDEVQWPRGDFTSPIKGSLEGLTKLSLYMPNILVLQLVMRFLNAALPAVLILS